MVLTCVVLVAAGVVQGTVGFGSGLVAVGLLAAAFGIKNGSVIFCIPALCVCLMMLLASVTMGSAAAVLDARLVVGFALYLLGFLVAAASPGQAFLVLAVINTAALLHIGWIWSHMKEATAPSPADHRS